MSGQAMCNEPGGNLNEPNYDPLAKANGNDN